MKLAGPDEEDTANIHAGEGARSTAVVFRGRLWQTGQEIGISVGAALAVLKGVVEAVRNSNHRWTHALWSPALPIRSSAL